MFFQSIHKSNRFFFLFFFTITDVFRINCIKQKRGRNPQKTRFPAYLMFYPCLSIPPLLRRMSRLLCFSTNYIIRIYIRINEPHTLKHTETKIVIFFCAKSSTGDPFLHIKVRTCHVVSSPRFRCHNRHSNALYFTWPIPLK